MGEMTIICTFANIIFRNTEAKKLNLLITKINDLYFEGRIPPNYHNTSEIKIQGCDTGVKEGWPSSTNVLIRK